MSAIDALFREWHSTGHKPLIPFLVAGDPDLETTAATLSGLSAAGLPLLEIGFPYSDPIADGPTIQAAYTRALQHGVRVADILNAVARIERASATSLVGMVSYALVFRHGVEAWVEQVAEAGLAGLIVPDLPSEEAEALDVQCRKRQIALVQLIAPTTSRDRARRILEHASGFVYYVSVTGVTGERRSLPEELPDRIAALRELTDLPICVGFGVHDANQVRLLSPHVDGVIVGSAVVKRMAQPKPTKMSRPELVDNVVAFCCELQTALNEKSCPASFS
ncbi:MAG TPA: tryptophan synthase subunit alpha [Pirellulaceae bacterium]|nr:tryptophan synthase subunit alpha [Pirellulaceae bacterium]